MACISGSWGSFSRAGPANRRLAHDHRRARNRRVDKGPQVGVADPLEAGLQRVGAERGVVPQSALAHAERDDELVPSVEQA